MGYANRSVRVLDLHARVRAGRPRLPRLRPDLCQERPSKQPGVSSRHSTSAESAQLRNAHAPACLHRERSRSGTRSCSSDVSWRDRRALADRGTDTHGAVRVNPLDQRAALMLAGLAVRHVAADAGRCSCGFSRHRQRTVPRRSAAHHGHTPRDTSGFGDPPGSPCACERASRIACAARGLPAPTRP
jgi:hypothetical protein